MLSPRAWLAALLPLTLAQAQPHVAVKARAYIDEVRAFARGYEVSVTGTLRDNLGQPVAGQRVHVRPGGHAATTGADGGFVSNFTLRREGTQTFDVRFPSGPLLGAAHAEVQVEIGRTRVEISLSVGDEVDAARPVSVGIQAADAGGRALGGVPLTVRLDGTALGEEMTDRLGRAALLLTTLTPGMHRLKVRWAGDDQRLPAAAEARIEATLPLQVELTAPQSSPAPGDAVVLEGRVLGGEGPDLEVVLTADGHPAARLGTRDHRFRAVLDADDLPVGVVSFRATAHSPTPGWRDGASADVEVTVPAPPPPSPWWVWAPALLAVASLAGVALWRRPRPEVTLVAPAAPPSLPPFAFEPAVTGLSVRVVDAVRGHALRAVVVQLDAATKAPHPAQIDPPPGARVDTGTDGRVELETAGARVWVWAPGYAASCHALPAQTGAATVRLLPLRARLQAIYAEVLRAAGRPVIRFGRATPREARTPLLDRGAPADPLVRLTKLVERACYGPASPAPREHANALALADEVRAGLRSSP